VVASAEIVANAPARPSANSTLPGATTRPIVPRAQPAPKAPAAATATSQAEASAAKKPYGKSSGGFAGKSGSYTGKSSGSSSFAGKKPYSKSAAGASAGPYDKFKDNKKPFGKRGAPARKFKPEEGESAE
jgi:hypothetical protein